MDSGKVAAIPLQSFTDIIHLPCVAVAMSTAVSLGF